MQSRGNVDSGELLLEEIQELSEQVESGDLCDGWGWDAEVGEERDFGDESWAEDIDKFFARAYNALRNGHTDIAMRAYEGILDILAIGEEAGHLPGPEDPEELLKTDVSEARARYLRAAYLATTPAERPSAILDVFGKLISNVGDEVNLPAMMDAGEDPLPDFPQFLGQWVEELRKTNSPVKGQERQYLLHEATLLEGGTTAMGDLARQQGTRHPHTYVEWIDPLVNDGGRCVPFHRDHSGSLGNNQQFYLSERAMLK